LYYISIRLDDIEITVLTTRGVRGVGRPSFKDGKEGRVFYEKKEEKHKIYYSYHYPPGPLSHKGGVGV
jgi:hypothetical protein